MTRISLLVAVYVLGEEGDQRAVNGRLMPFIMDAQTPFPALVLFCLPDTRKPNVVSRLITSSIDSRGTALF